MFEPSFPVILVWVPKFVDDDIKDFQHSMIGELWQFSGNKASQIFEGDHDQSLGSRGQAAPAHRRAP